MPGAHEVTSLVRVPGGGSVTAIETPVEGVAGGWRFLYAPGAGSNVHDPFGAYLCRSLAERGVRAVRFQFPYQEAKRRTPDRTPVLEGTWLTVMERFREPGVRLVVSGRSMGGRIASQVVAGGAAVGALALFAYPLHPRGRPEQLQDAHLPRINAPTLFCSGTRDAFASPAELKQAAARAPAAAVHLMEGADHGFGVLRDSGRDRADVWEEAAQAMFEWLRALQVA